MDGNIVGLDTSSKGFHWTSSWPLEQPGHRFDHQRIGWFTGKGDSEQRRIEIFHAAYDFFTALPPETYVFCEEPLALKNGKTTRLLALACGTIYGAFVAACQIVDMTWFWVDVASWKRAVVRNGAASKEQIRQFCRDNPAWQNQARTEFVLGARRYTYDEAFEEEIDLYDAWCLKVYGARSS